MAKGLSKGQLQLTSKQNSARSAVLKQARKKKTDPRHQCFSKYINKIIRKHETDITTTADTLAIMDSIVNDAAKQIIQTATKLVQTNNKKTITDWEIEAATRMYFRNCPELKKDFTSMAKNHVRMYKQTELQTLTGKEPPSTPTSETAVTGAPETLI
jgi:histone H3/H4